jgi:Putative restriction endonuclease
MFRKSLPIALAFVLLILCSASRGAAILVCDDCDCSFACTLRCVTDSGFSTCGAQGKPCAGSSSCGGGGCLRVADPDAFLESLRAEPGQSSLNDQSRGRVMAHLTWRLTQHVEEAGLGAVYAGNSGFLLSKATGRVQAPALAFVSREHLQAGSAWSGAPDLAVELHATAAAGWLKAGTRAVLVLDSDARTVSVYRSNVKVQTFGADDVLALSDVLPGWALRVGELFE